MSSRPRRWLRRVAYGQLGKNQLMRKMVVAFWMSLGVCAWAGCKAGGGKQEIPLLGEQTYLLQPSGKLKVYTSSSAEGASASQALHKLRVKRKNEGSSAKTPGCWACSDCICNGDDCACTECTSC